MCDRLTGNVSDNEMIVGEDEDRAFRLQVRLDRHEEFREVFGEWANEVDYREDIAVSVLRESLLLNAHVLASV